MPDGRKFRGGLSDLQADVERRRITRRLGHKLEHQLPAAGARAAPTVRPGQCAASSQAGRESGEPDRHHHRPGDQSRRHAQSDRTSFLHAAEAHLVRARQQIEPQLQQGAAVVQRAPRHGRGEVGGARPAPAGERQAREPAGLQRQLQRARCQFHQRGGDARRGELQRQSHVQHVVPAASILRGHGHRAADHVRLCAELVQAPIHGRGRPHPPLNGAKLRAAPRRRQTFLVAQSRQQSPQLRSSSHRNRHP